LVEERNLAAHEASGDDIHEAGSYCKNNSIKYYLLNAALGTFFENHTMKTWASATPQLKRRRINVSTLINFL
jgi:hypothetical protein